MSYPAAMFARIRPDTWGHLAIAAVLIVGVLVVGTVGPRPFGLHGVVLTADPVSDRPLS